MPTQFIFSFFLFGKPDSFFLRRSRHFFFYGEADFLQQEADFFFFYLSMLFPCSIEDTGFTRTFKTNEIRLGEREAVWGVYKDYTPQRSTTTTQGVVVSRIPYRRYHRSFDHLITKPIRITTLLFLRHYRLREGHSIYTC